MLSYKGKICKTKFRDETALQAKTYMIGDLECHASIIKSIPKSEMF